ncbi:hypothetical protein ACQPW1_13235 [Nocardia sp. CA-128927]|uniref:hypothetical protein n=1 Tax=Nocardia sp. CA-128927 TaxID=3239975 RepID=UPI003D974CEA
MWLGAEGASVAVSLGCDGLEFGCPTVLSVGALVLLGAVASVPTLVAAGLCDWGLVEAGLVVSA